jgi:asparagine synthase (glutamine-hydrolysing)
VCGIAGFVGPPDQGVLAGLSVLLQHRGPDDDGALVTPWASIASRRLAVLDIAHGHQPMSTADGRLHLAYNGEVYNYRELRDELRERGCAFETDSDTEVVLKAFEVDGPACFARFNGMFAAAFLDERGPAPRLVLARDHLGIKPLYHVRIGGRLVFASEIKAFLADPAFVPEPNAQRVYEYLRWGFHDYDQATFFEGVTSVAAGSYVVVDDDGLADHRFWTPRVSSDGDPDPAVFRGLFRRSVARRLVADVRVGTCLSGGLDSSSIVGMIADLLREHHPDAGSVGGRLSTFSAVFPGDPIDERSWMDAVLAATGAEGNFIEPSSAQLMAELPHFVWALEEPTVSSGPYAQWSVMRLAAGRVTVLLDGQGGDELLGGYTVYQFVYLRQLLRERRYLRLLREALRPSVARVFLRYHARDPRRVRTSPEEFLRPAFVAGRPRPVDVRSGDDLKLRLLQDLTIHSLPALLRYEDRTSMAHSIESRPPLLDIELVEHALTLPVGALVDRGRTRAILREAMKGILPEKVRLRSNKIGFTTPEMRWFTREREAVLEVFTSPSFLARPYWDGAALARAFDDVCAGRREQSLFFWRVLHLEMWLRVFMDGDAPAARQGRR